MFIYEEFSSHNLADHSYYYYLLGSYIMLVKIVIKQIKYASITKSCVPPRPTPLPQQLIISGFFTTIKYESSQIISLTITREIQLNIFYTRDNRMNENDLTVSDLIMFTGSKQICRRSLEVRPIIRCSLYV